MVMTEQVSRGTIKLGHNTTTSILNSISLNSSRERMNELFKDFKKLNIDSYSPVGLREFPSATKTPTATVTIPTAPSIVKTVPLINASQIDSLTALSSITDAANDSVGNESFEVVKTYTQQAKKLTALYVGDLDKSVTEEMLYKFFSKFKSLSSVKICYNPLTKVSLGYGYVNFDSEEDSKNAIEELNYTKLLSKEIRIMPSMKGKEKVFLGTNAFVSNLNTSKISSLRIFYETFKNFGSNILSCKVDLKKRQGFISFRDKQSALQFVSTVNESILYGTIVYCSIHVPKSMRVSSCFRAPSSSLTLKGLSDLVSAPPLELDSQRIKKSTAFTTPTVAKSLSYDHVIPLDLPSASTVGFDLADSFKLSGFKQLYLKGLPVDCSSDDIKKIFSNCGEISEIFVQNVQKYKSSWALVTLKNISDGPKAVFKLHRSDYKGCKLTCVRALKKVDRQHQLEMEQSASLIPTSGKLALTPRESFKLRLYNLPPGTNENFFKMFLKAYTFEHPILKYYISLTSTKQNTSFIEFYSEKDARSVLSRLNGVDIAGFQLIASLKELTPEEVNCLKIPGTCATGASVNSYASERENLVPPPSMNTTMQPTVSPTVPRSLASPLSPIPEAVYKQSLIRAQYHDQGPARVSRQDQSAIRRTSSVTSTMSHPYFINPMHHSNAQVVTAMGGGLFHLVPVVRPSRVNSDLTTIRRSSSFRGQLTAARADGPVESIEYLTSSLERIFPRYIDFLKYPVATRPRNMKRVVKYLVDTYWRNDLFTLKKDLSKIMAQDAVAESIFKEKLVQTIELFGFER